MGREDLVRVIREFTGTIINPFDLDELLHRLMRHATEVVGTAGAGVMLAGDDGKLNFVAASEERIVEAEQHQAHLETGACFEAYTANEIVVVDSLADDRARWPEYADRVSSLGLLGVLGVPMNAFGQTIGVINFYRDQPTTWTDADIEAAEIITAMGAGYILSANQLKAQHTLNEQLHGAVASRDVIGQAKGILMAEEDIDGDEAFERLRRRSRDTNRKLRDIAHELVEQREQRSSGATRGG